MHRVFVYGTLKRGFENHRLMETATFVGKAHTLTPYRMLDGEFPVMRDAGPDRMLVAGELYEVNARTLEALDELEGVAEGMYDRVEIKISVRSRSSSQEEIVTALVYVGRATYWDRQDRRSCLTLDERGRIDWSRGS